jgi:hypothetical protein
VKSVASFLSYKEHNNELMRERKVSQLSNVLQYVHKLIRETQRYLIIPLFRKSPVTIYKIFTPKSKKKQNFHKQPENCIYCMQNNRVPFLLLN